MKTRRKPKRTVARHCSRHDGDDVAVWAVMGGGRLGAGATEVMVVGSRGGDDAALLVARRGGR